MTFLIGWWHDTYINSSLIFTLRIVSCQNCLVHTHPSIHNSNEHNSLMDPSNLLMQVLGVQWDDQMNSYQEPSQKSLVVGNKPANALILDKVLAKENISVSGEDQGDQSAFKKLLASIQQQQPHDNLSSLNSVMVSKTQFWIRTHMHNYDIYTDTGVCAYKQTLLRTCIPVTRTHTCTHTHTYANTKRQRYVCTHEQSYQTQ